MSRIFSLVAAPVLVMVGWNAPAIAGVYSDDLGKCLVSSTSSVDKTVLVQWMFAALSAGPAVKPMSNVTPKQQDEYNQKAAALMQRLAIQDCHQQTIDAFKNEGPSSLELAFGMLGRISARSLMSDPAVTSDMQGLGKYLDKKSGKRWPRRQA